MTRKSNTTAGRAQRKHLESVRYHQGAAVADGIEARIRAKAMAKREKERRTHAQTAGAHG